MEADNFYSSMFKLAFVFSVPKIKKKYVFIIHFHGSIDLNLLYLYNDSMHTEKIYIVLLCFSACQLSSNPISLKSS